MTRGLKRVTQAVALVFLQSMWGAFPADAATPLVLQTNSYFFVGGEYVKTADGDVMDGQMYVHALVGKLPMRVRHSSKR